MKQEMQEIAISTDGQGCYEITSAFINWLAETGCNDGLLTVFIRHTSASLTIQENADRDVQADLTDALDNLAPQSTKYRHSSEGPDDMPAHIKSALTSVSLTVPVMEGEMALGTGRGIFLLGHRGGAQDRHIVMHFMGD